MKRQNLSVKALAKELTKLFAVAVLSTIMTLSVGNFKPQNPTDTVGERVELIETGAAIVEMGTFEEDPFAEVRGLLGYIRRFESVGAATSQGVQSAYQVVYGGIAATDRPTEALTSMTVAKVLAWQDSIDARYPSEAAGAYQVMEDTLRGLVDAGQIDPDAIFNEATQDYVAELLMKRRGLSKFVTGEISTEEFADNLAREWASFPVVRDQQGAKRYVERGQSYYAGDGLNKAHADPDEFLSIVERIRVTSTELPEDTTTAASKAPEQVTKRREPSENASETGAVTLGATKWADGPIEISGQFDFVDQYGWNILSNAEYVFESDIYEIGGSATYEKDDLSFSFSGAHDAGDNTEFSAEVEYRF
ncbi:hypothetical protein [Leisingera sp. M523]|uniref:hypothetical protein n=1 Tax=Leisingera sp. M523 TaxID=2867013 RepID=UPI0021A97614|nr:hypothetical protein [Leisingera sp. M523]UWQ29088.1 hypothetical protein K3557_00355 [Leisingera sp. M523]